MRAFPGQGLPEERALGTRPRPARKGSQSLAALGDCWALGQLRFVHRPRAGCSPLLCPQTLCPGPSRIFPTFLPAPTAAPVPAPHPPSALEGQAGVRVGAQLSPNLLPDPGCHLPSASSLQQFPP